MLLKQKLALYDHSPVSQDAAGAGRARTGKQLQPTLPGFIRKSEGLYACRGELLGTKDALFQKYLPLALSGILELALVSDKAPLHPAEVLFLDTETTGLSRGAGTIPFLTGLAWFEEDRLVLEQLFLQNPGGEAAYLALLVERLRSFPYLVTYNGKSFDLPLLRNRLILHRLHQPLPVQHFDLLHIFRRLFPQRVLNGYGQQRMEEELLAIPRQGDLPGAEIPQVYFDYVKYGEALRMPDVFQHNRLDMQGLALLFLEAIAIYDSKNIRHRALRSGIARILSRNQRHEEALALLETGESHPELFYRDRLLMAHLYRKKGDTVRALEAFEELHQKFHCPYALLSLVRLQEYACADYAAALRSTDLLLEGKHSSRSAIFSEASLQKRRQRLLARLQRVS